MPNVPCLRALLAFVLVISCVACASRTRRARREAAPRVEAAPPLGGRLVVTKALHGDSTRGRELVQRYECNRCHEGTGFGSAPLTQNCFSCHEQIITGRFPVSETALARFRPNVASAREAPSLVAVADRLQGTWIRDYLLEPRDLRPNLTPTMPRLALDAQQASNIASYLTSGASRDSTQTEPNGSPSQGRALMDRKGCAGCHAFSGVPAFTLQSPAPAGSDAARAAALAPDLSVTRERFRRDQLLGWLLNPKAVKSDTRMPSFDLSWAEANDIASYVLTAELAPQRRTPLQRLPVLARRVSFAEANQKVFSRTCHHCHTDAASAGGDGGPGNTGGFGFAPRGVSFSSHASILTGYLDARGVRRSLFEPLADGTPRLVAALLARHDEANGAPRAEVRGMPLGLPALSAADIQLVESWVAQGKPL